MNPVGTIISKPKYGTEERDEAPNSMRRRTPEKNKEAKNPWKVQHGSKAVRQLFKDNVE